jgi:hypothetical protein
MPLKPGRYQIRYVPPHITLPFAGGVYAVGQDINKPVEALPLGPFPGVRTVRMLRLPPALSSLPLCLISNRKNMKH